MDRWQLFEQDQINWLKYKFKKDNIDHNESELRIINMRKLFKALKNDLKQSVFNKDGQYFQKFKTNLQKHYLHMILYKDIRKNEDSLSNKNENKLIFSKKKIKINIIFKDMINSKKKDNRQQKNNEIDSNKSQSSIINDIQDYLNKKIEQYQQQLYENHRQFIRYLTNKRFQFKYIAMHIIRSDDNYLSFDIERGLKYNKDWNFKTNQIIIYLFIRDVALAILQLEKNDIYHADIALRNILLFNCQRQYLTMKYFLSYEHQVYFKFIDFGDALFMKGDNFEKYTKRIIKIRKKIPGILYNQPSFCQINPKNFKQQLVKLQQDQMYYKNQHSKHFWEIVKDNLEDKSRIDQIKELIDDRNYSQLAMEMSDQIQRKINIF